MMRKIYEFCIDGIKCAGWAPMGVFIFHMVATKVFNAYDHFPQLDIPMHFLGGLVICYFFWQSTRGRHADQIIGVHTPFSLFVLLVALTGTTTVLWEFAEWIADNYFGETAQISIDDTMLDMFLGLLGGAIIALLAATRLSKNQKNSPDNGAA